MSKGEVPFIGGGYYHQPEGNKMLVEPEFETEMDAELYDEVQELMDRFKWSRTDALLFILIRSVES